MFFSSEARALSVERVLIRSACPLANGADLFCEFVEGSGGKLLRTSKVGGKFLSLFGLRIAARSTLERVLKRNGLPPLCVRPLVVHPSLLSRLGVVRKLVESALLEVNNFHAREWIIRVVPGKKRRCSKSVNCKCCFQKSKYF